MVESSEGQKLGIISKAVGAVKRWGIGVRDDAKDMPGFAKDLGRAVGQVPVKPALGEASNAWRNPDTAQTLKAAQENKAAPPPASTQPAK